MRVKKNNHGEFQREYAETIFTTTQPGLRVEIPLKHPLNLLGGGDRYKIVYSDVAEKSRCVAGTGRIA